jgi:orotate phosphoribosyltransferase-like protein
LWRDGNHSAPPDSVAVDLHLEIGYIKIVHVSIEFNPSAFKHGITEAAIRYAMINAIYDDIWDNDADKHLVLGFDNNGNPLEVMYNIIDDNSVNVFHAMKCRSIYYRLIDAGK